MSINNLKSALDITSVDFNDNLTISFSGYNIKNYLQNSVGSFLALYPQFKNNIVVFDDNSTDGTKEWLMESGIKRITWTKYKDVAKMGQDIHPSFYCDMIVNDIMFQTQTKYLLVSDGDIVFHSRFLEKYAYLMKTYKALLSIGLEPITQSIQKGIDKGILDLIMLEEPIVGYVYLRAWQAHMLLDLEYIKNIGLIYASPDPMPYQIVQDWDSGAWFLRQLIYNNVPIYEIPYYTDEYNHISPYQGKNNIFEHFGLKSTTLRFGGK